MKLEAKHLCCGYDQRTVVDDFCGTFLPDRLYILMGKNGCGKTTLLNTLGGWLPAISGQAFCDGRDLFSLPARKRASLTGRIASALDSLQMSVGRFVLLGAYARAGGLYSAEDSRKADEAMKQMGIFDLRDQRMDEISAGQRQKAAIAQVLVQDPVCLFLDEPGASLDPKARFELMDLLKALRSPKRILIAVLHDLDLALRYGDELLVLNDHRLVFSGDTPSLLNSGVLESVFSIYALDYDTKTRTARFFLKEEADSTI